MTAFRLVARGNDARRLRRRLPLRGLLVLGALSLGALSLGACYQTEAEAPSGSAADPHASVTEERPSVDVYAPDFDPFSAYAELAPSAGTSHEHHHAGHAAAAPAAAADTAAAKAVASAHATSAPPVGAASAAAAAPATAAPASSSHAAPTGRP